MAQGRGHNSSLTHLGNTGISYSRENVLGSGGFSTVHLGRFYGNKVAVKKIQIHMSTNEEREIHLHAQLNHKNVLSIITATEDEDFRYMFCFILLLLLFLKFMY